MAGPCSGEDMHAENKVEDEDRTLLVWLREAEQME